MTEPEAAALFTVLLPVHRPPVLLPFAIQSVLAQRETRFRLCVICDGAPPETAACAREFAERDPRIRVFDFEKGERHGEAYRHQVLLEADTEFVAQIGDDDVWFPDFLHEMAALLATADFGNLPQTELTPDGDVLIYAGDLAHASVRGRMLAELWNIVGPTFVGYRLSAYRQLPVGWSPAPPDIWTDLHMWRKFLLMPDLRFATRFSVQGVKFSAQSRPNETLDERAAEISTFFRRLQDPVTLSRFQVRALEQLAVGQRQAHATHAAEITAQMEQRLAECQLQEEAARLALMAELTQLRSDFSAMRQELEDRDRVIGEISKTVTTVTSSRLWPWVRKLTPAGEAVDRISEIARRV